MTEEKLPEGEPEVYFAKLGCQHKLGTPEFEAWVDGYKKGMNEGGRIAGLAIEESFSRDG